MSSVRSFFVDGPEGDAGYDAWLAHQAEKLRREWEKRSALLRIADELDRSRWRDMPAADVPILWRQM